jgi:hypothetical protein
MRGVGGQFVIKKYGTKEDDVSAVQSHKSVVFRATQPLHFVYGVWIGPGA